MKCAGSFACRALWTPAQPDYSRARSAFRPAALRELISLGIIAVCTPIVVGFLLDVEAFGALPGRHHPVPASFWPVFMCNASGAWDNAKNISKKATSAASAPTPTRPPSSAIRSVIPSRTPPAPRSIRCLKVINLVALIIAPIVVSSFKHRVSGTTLAIMIILIMAVIWAIMRSKRAGEEMTSEEAEATGQPALSHGNNNPHARPAARDMANQP